MLHDVTDELSGGTSPAVGDPVLQAGFRSVERVTVIVEAGCTRAEATGVLHRYPQTVRVSLATARRLVAAGAPLSIDDRDRSNGRPARRR